MFTLIALGTGVAWAYSVVATVAPGSSRRPCAGTAGRVPAYFEAAAVITVLVLLGQVLELRARESTGGALRALLDLAPKTARRIRPDGSDEEVQLDAIGVGDRLRVRPGEKVPVDGAVVEGRSLRRREPGDGGNRCRSPRRSAPPSSAAASTSPARSSFERPRSGATPCWPASSRWSPRPSARALPSSASPTKSPAGSFPAVIGVAVLAFVAWMAFGPEPRFTFALPGGGGRAHHRLSLRARARPRRCRSWSASAAAPRPGSSSRTPRPGAHGEGHHVGGRQDRTLTEASRR